MTTWRSENVGRGHEACDETWLAICNSDAEEEITRWALEQQPATGPCSSAPGCSDGAQPSSLERDATGNDMPVASQPSIPAELLDDCEYVRDFMLDRITALGEHSLRVDMLRVIWRIEQAASDR